MDRSKELMTYNLEGMKRASIFWPFIALASIAIGYLTPIRRKENLKNLKNTYQG
ncbi:MAG: hypothetical protein JW976_11285 [Syntrophaceae bacterium]|nr:hypothetical protein [Syntrophaceae bacterium]